MNRAGSLCVVLVASGVAAACLDLGGVEDETSTPKPDASTGGTTLGDSSFPDAHETSAGGSSSGGTAGVGAGGVGGSDAGGLLLHVFDTAGGTWSSSPLSAVWFGQNAPPASGIRAVTQLEHFDKLLVVTDDGTLYVRSRGSWLPPAILSNKFPLVTEIPTSLFHVPSAPGSAESETVTFVLESTGVTYEYEKNDVVTYVTTEPLNDQAPPGPPQVSGTLLFDFEVRDAASYPSNDYFHLFSYYDDGNLYQLDAAANWKSWAVSSSPFWIGQSNAPNANLITAAWFDQTYLQAYFVGL